MGLKRRYTAPSPRAYAGLDAVVVSPGGVATTLLIEELSKRVRVNHVHDGDGLKHRPTPGDLPPQLKVIFVDGDFEDIFRSLNRRGFLAEQLGKLGSALGPVLPESLAKEELRSAVLRQRKAWEAIDGGRALFVEFDNLWEELPTIAAHVGLDPVAFTQSFPKRRSRQSQPEKA